MWISPEISNFCFDPRDLWFLVLYMCAWVDMPLINLIYLHYMIITWGLNKLNMLIYA